MRQTNVRGSLSLRGFRKLRTGAIVATGVILLGLGFLAPTVSANEQDGVWVARTVAEVKADIQNINNLSHYTIKWGDTLSAISGATGLSVDSLVEINRIANRDLIFANNQLYFSEEAFLKDGNTEVKRQQVSIDNSGSRQSYEVETKTDTVTGEQTTTVKQTTPVVVETPSTPAPKAEEPSTPAPKAEEPATPAPAKPAEETPASGTTETPTPAQPAEETPAPGATETPTPAQPAEETPASGATETPTPAQPVEDQPAAPGATETPTPAQPVEDQPAAPGATEQPTPSQPAENQPAGSGTTEDTPADSNNQNNPTEPKDDVEKGLEENDSELESRKNIKLEEIESSSLSSSEKEAAKLNVEEYTKKAKEAMKQAKTTEDQAAVVDNYSDDLAKINTPGVDQGKPDYTNSGLSGNGPAGTHIGDNNVIGHGNSTPENTAFRNAPVYQPRVTRRARSVDEPQNKVSIYYNFDGMKDIPGFFDDLGGKNEVDIPKDVSGDALKSILKARIDKKKAELERKGYKIADEYFVGIDQADATHYDYVVTFTKEKTGTTGFRIAPEVQVRAKKVVKRDLSNKTKQINIYYNLKALKDIAGALGELGGENMLTVSGDVSKEDLKRAIEEKTKAQIEKLKKQGFTVTSKTDLDQIVEGGDNYDYVIEFTKEAKTQPVGTTGFRMAPAVQPRASRNRRSLEQPAPQKVKVNVFYNFDKMKDIAGFLGDINGTPLEIAEGSTDDQVKAAVKNQVDAKKEELRKRGYTVKEDYLSKNNGKDYNYVVTFTKEATGTSGFRMAPAVQPRASRNRRSLEQLAPQKVKVNVFYNFDKMKDIAGFLGDINGTSLEIAEGLSTEQVKAAVKSQVDAKKEELSKRGYTFKEDYVYQANGKDYNYVVTFSKAAK